jgi:hypothetical protein
MPREIRQESGIVVAKSGSLNRSRRAVIAVLSQLRKANLIDYVAPEFVA